MGLRNWLGINDSGLLAAASKRNRQRDETMRELFGTPAKPGKPMKKKKKKKDDQENND